jgi:hypothetical protein
VNLKDEVSRPDYYIVPSKVVAEYVKKGHAKWLGIPGKKGPPHKDNPVRKFLDAEASISKDGIYSGYRFYSSLNGGH